MDWLKKIVSSVFSEQRLIQLAHVIIRKVFNRVYADIKQLVVIAEAKYDNGFDKAKYVWTEFIKTHDEWSEWKPVFNLIMETAVNELKGVFNKSISIKGIKKLF